MLQTCPASISSAHAAFTFLEVLIAVAILAGVGITLFTAQSRSAAASARAAALDSAISEFQSVSVAMRLERVPDVAASGLTPEPTLRPITSVDGLDWQGIDVGLHRANTRAVRAQDSAE